MDKQVPRVLRLGGRWLYVTYRQPRFLRPLFERERERKRERRVLKFEVETLPETPGSFEYFGSVTIKWS